LDETLNSILNQSYTNWECIIVNDGSPDETENVAKKWNCGSHSKADDARCSNPLSFFELGFGNMHIASLLSRNLALPDVSSRKPCKQTLPIFSQVILQRTTSVLFFPCPP
jgi:glycosyltransferase involved in cell wall biosynthesis